MIRLLRDCFDKKGNRYKAISFNGGRYQCQSYATGKCVYFDASEIFSFPPKKMSEKIKFTEIIKKAQEQKVMEAIIASKPDEVHEPVYEEPVYEPIYEPVYEEAVHELKHEEPRRDYGISENEKAIISKDNVKETAEDFYADF